MSSSHPKNQPVESGSTLECHACGKLSMVRKKGNPLLADGMRARGISYWSCAHCGEILLDIPAMRKSGA
jgi:hypothetical protein